MTISVLMANFNNDKHVKESINSVLKQTLDNWELVVIDDCSTDNSEEIIKCYLSDERIKYYKNENNIGFTATLKKLVDKARGEVLCILDSDDAINENTLKEIAVAYKNNPDCGFVYTQCYYCDENLIPKHLGFSARIPEGKTNLHVNSVVAARTFKKEAYLKTAGYDEEILFAEDIDLTLKMEEVTKLFFIDKPLYYYRVLPKSQTHGFRNEMINRSSTALAKLNAYKRRLGTDIPDLDKNEISEVLFWGIFSALAARRLKLVAKFARELAKINPLFFLRPGFYNLVFKKIIKIIKIKNIK